jgi:hypothetical protein
MCQLDRLESERELAFTELLTGCLEKQRVELCFPLMGGRTKKCMKVFGGNCWETGTEIHIRP